MSVPIFQFVEIVSLYYYLLFGKLKDYLICKEFWANSLLYHCPEKKYRTVAFPERLHLT